MNMKSMLIRSFGLVACVAAVGCMDANKFNAPEATQMSVDAKVKKEAPIESPAGIAIMPPAANVPLWTQLIHSHNFSARPDPFALEPKEINYERDQTTQRLFSSGLSPWSYEFDAEEAPPVLPEPEPQPYRRLAGIIVGDSVLALIDMGDGKLQLIRPGQDIDGWHVESISAEGPSGTAEAILTRSGNRLPHRITVRLEEPPLGGGSPGGGGGGGNNNNGGPSRPGGGPGLPGGKGGGPGLPGGKGGG